MRNPISVLLVSLAVLGVSPSSATPSSPTSPPSVVHRAEQQGWSATFPPGWLIRDDGGLVLAGSNTEAGLLIVRFEAGATAATLAAAAAQGVAADGVTLRLRAPARTVRLKTHGRGADDDAVAAEFDGFANTGAVLAASALAVVGKAGAVTVFGVTSPEQLAPLTRHILAVASSVSFFAPKAPPAVSTQNAGALRGSLCSWSGGSTYSSTTRANFDGAGHVSLGGESAIGGNLTDSGGNEVGRFAGGVGNQYDPSTTGTYEISGDSVTVRWPNGDVTQCTVNMRQPNGAITEVMCGKKLFGSALCG